MLKAGDDCTYKASDALNNELVAEIHRKDDEISRLREQIKRLSGLSGSERDTALAELSKTLEGGNATAEDTPTPSDSSPADAARISELSIDDGGHVRHHGATSRFYSKPYVTPTSEPDSAEEDYHRKWLRSNARFQPSWEAKAMERLEEAPVCEEIDPANAKVLLEIFWAWQAPQYNWIYRRCGW